jgi:cyclopropane fatty-acyl-phospholipid synthase-like methyltransferase
MMHRAMMNAWYRYGTPPWVMGPRDDLVAVIEDGRLPPGRALDLGCGAGDNSCYLAEHGFDVTGVDFAASAVERARAQADERGLSARFVEGDLTNLQGIEGPFDVLVDYGTYDDLGPEKRRLYRENVLPLARPGALFLIFCFEWTPRWWERALGSLFGGGGMVSPGEIESTFGELASIEEISRWQGEGFIRETATYLLRLSS